MAEVPKGLKPAMFGRGPKFHTWVSLFLEFLGLACLVLGVVAAATDQALGLGSTNWILVAIAVWIWAFWSWLTAYLGAKEG